MKFVYFDNIKNFNLKNYDKDVFIIDYNIKNYFYIKNKFSKINYKRLYSEFNYIPYIKVYNDIKYNCLYSCYNYIIDKNLEEINLVFCERYIEKNCLDFFGCINSFVKRKNLNKILTPKFYNNLTLKKQQIKNIFSLTKFLIKTKIISDKENFFDFICNYYFYLNQDESFI